jgi:hypothetical protein
MSWPKRRVSGNPFKSGRYLGGHDRRYQKWDRAYVWYWSIVIDGIPTLDAGHFQCQEDAEQWLSENLGLYHDAGQRPVLMKMSRDIFESLAQ